LGKIEPTSGVKFSAGPGMLRLTSTTAVRKSSLASRRTCFPAALSSRAVPVMTMTSVVNVWWCVSGGRRRKVGSTRSPVLFLGANNRPVSERE
jgi:hypothetical protein